ncbi:hypothetical protein W04_2299 [Pseudoalteromonas sp. SW0106-04]|nr:hypothetical protein W04_2299 [Pseudoalteromonas sp. SW0106-04]
MIAFPECVSRKFGLSQWQRKQLPLNGGFTCLDYPIKTAALATKL